MDCSLGYETPKYVAGAGELIKGGITIVVAGARAGLRVRKWVPRLLTGVQAGAGAGTGALRGDEIIAYERCLDTTHFG